MERDKILDFIKKRYVMVGCAASNNMPMVFTAWYVTENCKVLYYKSRTESSHAIALVDNPNISLAIYDHNSSYSSKTGVQLKGKVSRVTDLLEMTKVVKMYSEAFVGSGAKLQNIPELISSYVKSTMFKITLEQVKMVDSSDGTEMVEYITI
jgi:uncharacterized protein YhbP (UPF0306 family)